MHWTRIFSLRQIGLAVAVSTLVLQGALQGEAPSGVPVNHLRAGNGSSPSEKADADATQAEAVPGVPTPAASAAAPATPERLPGSTASPGRSPAESGATSPTAEEAAGERPADRGSRDEPLQPIPDLGESGVLDIQAAAFKGVVPGRSSLADVQKSWGTPLEIRKQDEVLLHLYRVEPFERVEVALVDGKVATIIIRLDRPFPADLVAQQLELAQVQPVLVSNELGEILGQSFPERGVLFAFEASDMPGKATMKVVQIILEPITAEPFLLRAETLLESQPESTLRDLDQAVKLAPQNARVHWLRARVLASKGEVHTALAAAEEAVRLEADNPRYLVTQGQILGSMGRIADAIPVVHRAVAASEQRPHVKARALCMLGDLYGAGPQPDYKKAMDYHSEAIKTADLLAMDHHPAVRLAAKEVLIDAHLGAAHNIAWGNWNQKEVSVPRWLKRAAAFAEEMIENEGGTPEHRFRVSTRALAACVGMRGDLDPTEWAEETLRTGEQVVSSAGKELKQQYQWDIGMALYDAVQVYQLREEHQVALKYGEQAVAYLEKAMASRPESTADRYLIGRLYFRLGAIHAVGSQDHPNARLWFEKAIPALEASLPQVNRFEVGRLGETFVSMGVSYWEVGEQQRAVTLTEKGVGLMEQAAKNGHIQQNALEIPYGNLASMHRQLGQEDEAGKYLQKASRTGSDTMQR